LKKVLFASLIFVTLTGFSAFAVKVAVIDSTYAGHGPTICNIIKQQAPGADVEFIPISNSPQINALVAAQAIYEAVNEGADIINLSFGAPYYSQALADAINYAISRGVVVVAAAGNDGGLTPNFPAALPGVISVGALDGSGKVAFYSNRGADVFAPGTAYNGMQGTSFAAPYVAGQIARKMTEGNLSATQAAREIVGSGYGQRVIAGPVTGGIGVGIQDPGSFIPPEQILPDEEIWYELLALIHIMNQLINEVFADLISTVPVYEDPTFGGFVPADSPIDLGGYEPVIPSPPDYIGL
jgi:subtilisin family serine protease